MRAHLSPQCASLITEKYGRHVEQMAIKAQNEKGK
jgi:hypothetical protein